MTNMYIISGFLGAGKTTLIKTMVKTAFENQKVVVIENDFGQEGIDATVLRECKLTVTSLNAGCICCSMAGDFEKAISQIVKEYEPDAILVEPSGVGKLSEIIRSCYRQKEIARLFRCITVVDGGKFDKYRENYGEYYRDQIQYADLILLSHQDSSYDSEPVIEKIKGMNKEARIVADFWEGIPASVFLSGKLVEDARKLEMEVTEKSRFQKMMLPGRQKERKGFFTTVTVDCEEPLTEKQLKERIRRVTKQADGMILRGKGILESKEGALLFHYIPGFLKIQPCMTKGHSVCFIGTGLKKQQIITLFEGDC
jgi:G3E family GTPase